MDKAIGRRKVRALYMCLAKAMQAPTMTPKTIHAQCIAGCGTGSVTEIWYRAARTRCAASALIEARALRAPASIASRYDLRTSLSACRVTWSRRLSSASNAPTIASVSASNVFLDRAMDSRAWRRVSPWASQLWTIKFTYASFFGSFVIDGSPESESGGAGLVEYPSKYNKIDDLLGAISDLTPSLFTVGVPSVLHTQTPQEIATR